MPTFESSADRPSWSFHRLLKWHFQRGTAPTVPFGKTGPQWERKAFAGAVGYQEGGDRTVSNWLSGASLPSAGYYAKVEEALFGTNPEYEGWKIELREALLRERESRQRPQAGTSATKTPPSADGRGAEGKSGTPADDSLVASEERKLDERGRTVEVAYFDSDGRPTLNQDRVARIAWKLDEHGRVTEEAYFGVDGEPVLSMKEGVARTVSEHDSEGRLIARSYFGIDGRPMVGPLGAARIRWRLNEQGTALEENRLFGNDDQSDEAGLLQ